MDVIYKNSILLQNIIFDILDFSQIKSSKLRLNKKIFRLADLASDTKQLFEQQAREKSIQLIFQIAGAAEQEEVCVYTDRQRLQ